MSQMNEFDNFNFSGFSGVGNENQTSEDEEKKRTEKRNMSNENFIEEKDQSSNFVDGFGGKENDDFHQNFSNHLNDGKMNETLTNLYEENYFNKIESTENVLLNDFGKVNSNTSKSAKDDEYNKDDGSPTMEGKMFENSGEQFFDKDSDFVEFDEANVWEIERLKRIEERKEYEIKMRKEIKEKAAEDLRKWYEEMAVKIEERKNIFNQQKLEEKKKEEDLQNKTWLKVSQYLEFEKGEYFKEDSRIKQILLKLIKQENS